MMYFIFFAMGLLVAASTAQRPKVVVYRGPAACNGCPESVGYLLESSPYNFRVTYAGPNEDVDVTCETLRDAVVYAQPGGGDYDRAWPDVKGYKSIIRDYVAGGGRYMGFCLGAFFAGASFGGTPGFDLLPAGDNTNEECLQPGAQVKNRKDTVIQVNWHFTHGPDAGQTKPRWVYFQDGAVLQLEKNFTDVQILGRYTSNNDIAASLSRFGDGWVALTGPHPEATKDWYTPHHIKNPDGYGLYVGYDFVQWTMDAK